MKLTVLFQELQDILHVKTSESFWISGDDKDGEADPVGDHSIVVLVVLVQWSELDHPD